MDCRRKSAGKVAIRAFLRGGQGGGICDERGRTNDGLAVDTDVGVAPVGDVVSRLGETTSVD